ncbi:MAG: hypothetical protein COA78_04990 [Blastopirellula sp.]|nr:MAG: hypothetical protein COA78_04990 [Blastopirellula sp.]
MSAELPEDQNPYASPAITETLAVVPGEYELIGQRIVGRSPIVLPECCVKCGDDALTGKRLKKTLTWSPPWIALFILLGPLILAIVLMVVQKKVNVEYSLCGGCSQKRWSKVIAVWLLIVLMLICWMLAGLFESVMFACAGMVLFLGAFVFALLSAVPIKAKDYQDPVFYLCGANAFFEAMALRETTNQQAILAEESY